MNTRLLMVLLFSALTLVACKKEAPVTDPNAGSNARFTVKGVKDVDLSLSSSGIVEVPINVVANAGAQPDTVSLQLDGLPAGVTGQVTPAYGKTSFSAIIRLTNTFKGPGGSFKVNLVAIGKSGNMTYPMILTAPGFRGWSFNETVYSRDTVIKNNGVVSGYPYIYADAYDGSRLVINFPHKSALPKSAATYKIGGATADGTLQLQFIRDSTQIFVSMSVGDPTASFSFDSLGKFIFKCSNVRMSNGITTGILNVSLPE